MKFRLFFICSVLALLATTEAFAEVKPKQVLVQASAAGLTDWQTIKAENDLGVRRIKVILSGKAKAATSLSSRLNKVLEKLQR
jgi:hypothetical protein